MSDLREVLDRAVALQRAGQALEAHRLYREILDQDPRMPEALHFLSMIEIEIGNTDSAIALIKRLLAIDPNLVVAHYNLGLVRQRIGDLDNALISYRAALARQPRHPLALYNSAWILRTTGRLAEAAQAYAKLVQLEPGWADALINYTEVLLELGRWAEALVAADKALAVEDSAIANFMRAQVLRGLTRDAEALVSCDKAIALAPDDHVFHHFRGGLLQLLQRYDESIDAYDRELTLIEGLTIPQHALNNAISESISVRLSACHWARLPELENKARQLTQTSDFTIDPFVGVLWSDDPQLLLTWGQRWRHVGNPPAVARPAPAATSRKIRLGYISADFREHAVARLLVGLIETHDRDKFDVIGYSIGPDDKSPMRERITAAFDEFVDLTTLNDLQAAERIASDRIDVLIDLMGHTANARLGILARRPVPVVAHYLGYPGSVGTEAVDYFIADAMTLPPADEVYFNEAIARLPTTYQVNGAREMSDRLFTRAEAGLPERGVVFCGITRQTKLNPELFDAWTSILRGVEGSVLWLLAATPFIEGNLRSEATARGIDPGRLIFAPYLPAPEYLARHKLADLFLDTWPWGGHTMASDALWAGLPVLTAPGRNFASRVGASLLTAVGVPELICPSREAYVAKAIELGRDPAQLAAIRAKLAKNKAQAPLFDSDRFRREFESACLEMHARHLRGEKPASFTARVS